MQTSRRMTTSSFWAAPTPSPQLFVAPVPLPKDDRLPLIRYSCRLWLMKKQKKQCHQIYTRMVFRDPWKSRGTYLLEWIIRMFWNQATLSPPDDSSQDNWLRNMQVVPRSWYDSPDVRRVADKPVEEQWIIDWSNRIGLDCLRLNPFLYSYRGLNHSKLPIIQKCVGCHPRIAGAGSP